MTARKTPTSSLQLRCARLIGLAASVTSTLSFAAPPASETAAGGEKVVELSPFTVDATRDTGYAALETTSGTRMRSSLRDIAAPLSVITAELLQDLAATSPVEALLFTPSVDTVDGGPQGGAVRFGDGQPMAIRGFVNNEGSVAASNDYFRSFVSRDVYNTERITLSRGPNPLLFGVGTADGVVESGTKRARFDRVITQFQWRYDTWGSHRFTLDHNRLLLKDRLAVRINGLFDRKREFRDFEGSNQKRVTLGVTVKPFAGTKIFVNREDYRVDRNIAPLTWAYDNGAMQWVAKGRPTVDFSPTGSINAAQKALFDPRNSMGQLSNQSVVLVNGLGLAQPMVNWRFQFNLTRHQFDGALATDVHSMDPFKLFGIAKETTLAGGTWNDPSDRNWGSTSQAFIEQRITGNLYVEFAGSWMRHDRDYAPTSFDRITIDPNRYWVDGSPNPGFLQPYGETANNQYREVRSKSDGYRATVWYEWDLGRIHRWLGRQNFGLLSQYTETTTGQDVMRWFNRGTVGLTNWNPDPLNAVHGFGIRTYFVGGKPAYPFPDAIDVARNVATLNAQKQIIGKTPATFGPIDLVLRPFVPVTKNREENQSYSLGWQGHWLNRRLVTLVGWRRDDIDVFTGLGPFREWADPLVPESGTNELRRYYSLQRNIALNSQPDVSATANTRTASAVLNVFSWLALTYNQARNFTPSTNPSFTTLLNERPGDQSGESRDLGVRTYLLDGRLSLSLSRFENSTKNQIRGGSTYAAASRGIMNRLRQNYSLDSHFKTLPPSGLLPVDGTVATDWNFDASGYELTTIFNPSRRWRVSLTGSINENVLGEHVLALGKYLYTEQEYQGLATWRRFAAELRKVEAGQRSSSFDLDPQNSAHRLQAGTDARDIDNGANGAEKQYWDERALEGRSTNWNGKYAVNLVATHVFDAQGPLKGWSLGGNFRWRSGAVAGYQRQIDARGVPEGVIEVNRPIMGDAFADLGTMLRYQRKLERGMGLTVQLNVQNLLNWQDPRLVKVATDSEGILGPQYAPVGITYTLQRPRNFTFTTTLDF